MYKIYEVCFEYADSYSNWEWRKQRCTVEAKDENEAEAKCMKIYGLGTECDYEITSVKVI